MASDLYTQYLDKAGQQTGTSIVDIVAAEKAHEDALNAQNLAMQNLADFTPGEFNADEMLDEAGWAGYGPMDVMMGAAMKPMYAHMAQQGIDWTKRKLSGKTGQNIATKAITNIGGKTAGKSALKLGGKAASRAIPGLGWALGIADLVDYFVYPIYDHIPGGDYMTWR